MKIIIFDSSTIINFSMNGLTEVLRALKSIFNGKFIITNQVKKETIDRPLTIRKFKLGALKVKQLIDEEVLEFPEAIGINNSEINKKTNEILNQTNRIYFADNEYIKIIHDGEAACLALSTLAHEKGIDNLLAIDERTTRLIVENPNNLRKLLKKKLHKSVQIKNKLPDFKKIKIIRSSELVYLAFKKEIISLKDGTGVLDALLYATKFKGAAISHEEIESIKKIAR